MKITDYTESQKRAARLIDKGENVFITGMPGTGKTELLRDICKRKIAEGKNVMATASTGLAASIFDSASTLHHALGYRPGKTEYDMNMCTKRLQNQDILVVDEVSMLDPYIINHVAKCLRYIGNPPQLIMSGDFLQLPPVTRHGYQRQYPFENPNWNMFHLTPCVLKEIVRQKDSEHMEMLGRARVGDLSCISYFNKKTQKKHINGAITLCTRNAMADAINAKQLDAIPGAPMIYSACGDLKKVDFNKTRVKKDLVVKKWMRVMALRNDPEMRYQNGSLGTVVGATQDHIIVWFDNGNRVGMQRVSNYIEDDLFGNVEVLQFPLCAAYAITIHKSQGQTYEYVNILAPDCWDPGQLFVALSRGKYIDGIHLEVPIDEGSLIADPKALAYYDNLLCGYAA